MAIQQLRLRNLHERWCPSDWDGIESNGIEWKGARNTAGRERYTRVETLRRVHIPPPRPRHTTRSQRCNHNHQGEHTSEEDETERYHRITLDCSSRHVRYADTQRTANCLLSHSLFGLPFCHSAILPVILLAARAFRRTGCFNDTPDGGTHNMKIPGHRPNTSSPAPRLGALAGAALTTRSFSVLCPPLKDTYR